MVEYIIAGVGFAIAARYFNKHLPQIKGSRGERKLARAVKRLKLPGKVKILRDSLFHAEWGGTSQVDVIAVTRYGVLILENKNFNCDVYGALGDHNWSFKYPSGGLRKDPFDYTPSKKQYAQVESEYSPVKQNSTHVSVVASILREQYPQVPFYPLVVFSNDTNLYVQNSRNKVCNLHQLPNVIPRILGKEVLTDKQVAEISDILKQAQIKGRQARKNHITNIELGKEMREEYSEEDLRKIQDDFLRMAENKPVLSAEGERPSPEQDIPMTYSNRPLSQILQTVQNRGSGTNQMQQTRTQPDRHRTR